MIKPDPLTPRRRAILLRAFQDARHATEQALKALSPLMGELSDWESDYGTATREHRERTNCLRGVLSDLDAITMHLRGAPRELVVTFDVSSLTPEQIDALVFEVVAQAEDGDGHPTVPPPVVEHKP